MLILRHLLRRWMGGGLRAVQDATPGTHTVAEVPPGALAPVAARAAPHVRPHWLPPRGLGRAAWIVARREMVDVVSDWRIVGPALLLVVVFPLLVVVMSAQGAPFLAHRFPGFSVGALVPFGLMIVGFFPVSFSLMMALETFAGEKERNSLEALFSSPLSDRALYAGKTLAALLPPVLASYLSMAIYFGGVVVVLHYRPDFGMLAAVAVLDLAQALVMVAAALIISSHTTSVRAANLLASFIILPMSLVLQFNNLFVIWGAVSYLWLVALGLGVFALLLLRMGLRLFNREDILTREVDEIKGGQWWAAYRRALALPPRWALLARTPDPPPVPDRLRRPTLRRLYVHDIPALLRLRAPELGLVVLTVVVAFSIGWNLAGHISLPALFNAAGQPPPPEVGQATLVSGGRAASALAEIPLVLIASTLLAGVLIVLALISFGTLALLFMMLIAGLFGFLLGSLAGVGLPPAAILLGLALPQIALPALAFILLTAFAVRFGLALLAPPRGFGLGDSLILAAAEYTKILALAGPLLIAGFALQAALLVLFR
jgi:ABC-type transport system involved in multi-copper enzyme maturation permease subunit